MDGPKVVIQQGEDGSWYWHAQAGNNEVVCQGEGHTSYDDAKRAAHTAAATIRTAFEIGAIEYR